MYEGRSLGARSLRKVVQHLTVSLEASFQHLVMAVVAYLPTIVKIARKYYILKPCDCFKLHILYSWCLVCWSPQGEGPKIKDCISHKMSTIVALTLVKVCKYTRILIYFFILGLWWQLVSRINLDKSEWIVYLNKTSQMVCVILIFFETEVYFVK